MKIAIVAPSSVPFTVGGAENLYWGLQNFINEETQFQCELVKVPSRESTFSEIIESYKSFSQIELKYFDTLISTKYPSWMVSHPNHVCYMLHTLRGLYDTYHFMREPEHFEWTGDRLVSLKTLMQRAIDRPDSGNGLLSEFFGRLDELMKSGGLPVETFRFPGPFSRQIVHFLDSYGLAKHSIKKYAAISANVKQRQSYFPNGAGVSVLYPPPRLKGFRCEGDDYLFTTSRLDGPKRIGLLIEAMRHVKSNIPLLIAGTGPELEKLKLLANGDARINFLGFLSDEELVHYYANALAVLFVPYDEDYGYITIEAMRSGKPVLTVTDSGGPNEFVINGETGFSVQPESERLADRIDYLCTHRSEARAMGRNAQKRVSSIHWRSVVEGLTGTRIEAKPRPQAGPVAKIKRKKIVVAVTFPIYPPRGGGQARVFHLYKNLAHYFDIEIVSFCNSTEPYFSKEIAPGLKETRIPKSAAHQDIENKYSEGVGWIPVTDIVMSQVYMHTPEYVEALRSACIGADVAIACHPYLADAIRAVAPNTDLWLEAQDVEFELKRQLLPDGQAARRLLDITYADEHKCWKESRVVFACANEDLHALSALYGSTAAVQLVVPNGVSLDDVRYFDDVSRSDLKSQLHAEGKRLALFMGSWHGPNLEAIEQILGFSKAFPNVTFLIVGSAGLAFAGRVIPENVVMVGVVDDEEKNLLLGCADVALNPMMSGTGSNLKMLDYFSAGIPVISTPFGARGIEAVKGTHYISADIDAFILELAVFFGNPAAYKAMAKEARKIAEVSYSWAVIAKNFYAQVEKFLEDRTLYATAVSPSASSSVEAKREIEDLSTEVPIGNSLPNSSIVKSSLDQNQMSGGAALPEDGDSSRVQQALGTLSLSLHPPENQILIEDAIEPIKILGKDDLASGFEGEATDAAITRSAGVINGAATLHPHVAVRANTLEEILLLPIAAVATLPSKAKRPTATEKNRAKAQRKKNR